MSTKEENKLDELTRKVVRETALETPAPAVKANIMAMVTSQGRSSIRFRSLIPAPAKAMITAVFVACIILATYLPDSGTWLKVTEGKLDKFSDFFENMSHYLPNTFLYGLMAFGCLVWIQISFLKRRLNDH